MTHWRTKACVCLWSYRVTKQKVHNSGESNNVLTLKKGVVKISEEFKGQGKVCKCAVRLKDRFHSKPVWKLLQAHLSGEVIQATHLDEVRTVSRCPCTVSSSLSTLTHKGLTPHRINLQSCSATRESNYSVCLQISFSIQNKASGGQIAYWACKKFLKKKCKKSSIYAVFIHCCFIWHNDTFSLIACNFLRTCFEWCDYYYFLKSNQSITSSLPRSEWFRNRTTACFFWFCSLLVWIWHLWTSSRSKVFSRMCVHLGLKTNHSAQQLMMWKSLELESRQTRADWKGLH